MLHTTDEQLEDSYGHYSPTEIMSLDISNQEKARITQLQIESLGRIGLSSAQELVVWTQTYTTILGPCDAL